MAKESGLAFACSVDDSAGGARDISNDITSLTFGTPSAEQDTTGLDKSAHERLLLLADASVSLNGVFNDAAQPASHLTFKDYRTLSGVEVGRTTSLVHSGQTLTMEILYTDYALNRPATGELTWTAPGNLSDGTVPAWS